MLWNSGDRTVYGSDLVKSDPLRVEIPENSQILKYVVLGQTRNINAWNITLFAPHRLHLEFDFLDTGDGIDIWVIHSQTGKALTLKGTVRGMPEGLRDYGSASWSDDRLSWLGGFRRRDIFGVAFAIGTLLVLLGLLEPWINLLYPDASTENDLLVTGKLSWILICGGLLNAAFAAYALWTRRKRHPNIQQLGQDNIHENSEA